MVFKFNKLNINANGKSRKIKIKQMVIHKLHILGCYSVHVNQGATVHTLYSTQLTFCIYQFHFPLLHIARNIRM